MLKDGLVERTNDKEPTIRSLAITCIAQVYANEVQEDVVDEDEQPGRDILLEILPREPSRCAHSPECCFNPDCNFTSARYGRLSSTASNSILSQFLM